MAASLPFFGQDGVSPEKIQAEEASGTPLHAD
jgi:hypothetical protein